MSIVSKLCKTIFLIGLASAVVACGERSSQPTDDQETAAQEARELNEAVTEEIPELSAMRDELVASGIGYLRYDRTQSAPGEGEERQVYLEMLKLGVDDAASSATEMLVEQGFSLVARSGGVDDVHLILEKPGKPPVRLRVRSRERHSNLTMDEALSSVYATHPVQEPSSL